MKAVIAPGFFRIVAILIYIRLFIMIPVRAEGAHDVKKNRMTFADAGVILCLACLARLRIARASNRK